MSRLPLFAFTTTFLTSGVMFTTSAFAADAGTYRPGNAYHSITAGSPNICEMQCSGDAQCRSWNYIRLNDGAQGVCEFNDNISSPVPSSMSISGENDSRARASRVVPGKTNTVRVGSPSVTQAMTQPSFTQQRSPSFSQPPVGTARSMGYRPAATPYQPATPQREAFARRTQQPNASQPQNLQAPRRPQPTAPTQFSAAAPNSAYAQQRPKFRHNLDDARSAHSQYRPSVTPQSAPQPAPQQSYAQADPRLQKKLQQRSQAPQQSPTQAVQTYPPLTAPSTPQSYAAAAGGTSSPPGVPPLTAPQNAPFAAPAMAGAPSAQVTPRRVNIPAELSPRPMGSSAGLFGSLYDDVKVPRPIDPSLAVDPDAPIATVSTVPSSQFSRPPL